MISASRLFISLGLALVSASAAAAAADKGTPLDACAFLTAEEVSAAVGAKVGLGDRHDAGETADGAYSSTCLWKIPLAADQIVNQNAPLGGARFAMLNILNWPAGSGQAVKYLESFRDAAKSDLLDMTPTPVKAGDEALWWGDGVAVRKGDISFGVSVHVGVDKPAEKSMEESLAKKVVPRL